jgi:hypothetical protein
MITARYGYPGALAEKEGLALRFARPFHVTRFWFGVAVSAAT